MAISRPSPSRPPAERAPTARSAALEILYQVLGRGMPLDHVLADRERNGGLDQLEPRDRGFARTLSTMVLRRLGQIDRVLSTCMERPLPDKHKRVYDIMRLGAAQILFLGTPHHAAVNSTVSLVPRRSGSFRGVVNAILRRLTREGMALIADDDAARVNTPDWLWLSWSEAYGDDTARKIAEAHMEIPPLDFTVTDPTQTEQIAASLDARILPTGTLRRTVGGKVEDLPGFSKGAWWVQDAAAALPANLLLSAAQSKDRDFSTLTALDLCAAPGGKTAQLAAAGLQVTAVDRSAKRLGLLARNLDRLGLKAKTVTEDAAAWRPSKPADLVLLDAPCTATGTLRRHPDIAHLKSQADVDGLAGVQAGLLRAAADMTAPGGVLVYAVCSLQAEEGAQVVTNFLAETPGFERLPITASEVGGRAELITGGGDLRTMPCHDMDGFYAARLIRAA